VPSRNDGIDADNAGPSDTQIKTDVSDADGR
jgi:hypothetical protein